MNVTTYKFSIDDLSFNTFEKIVIVLLWLVIQILGNTMLLGLIHFDWFGGDPLKRRLQDQLFTLGCMIALLRNLTCFNLLTISALFDIYYPFFISYIYQLIRFFSITFYFLLVIQTCIIRLWIEFVWKSIRSINDSFAIVCITVINTLLSFIFAAGLIWNGEGWKGTWRLSHNHPLLMTVTNDDHPLRSVRSITTAIFLVVTVVVVMIYLLAKLWQKYKQRRRNLIVVAPLNIVHHLPPLINNLQFNPTIVKSSTFILHSLSCLIYVIFVFTLYKLKLTHMYEKYNDIHVLVFDFYFSIVVPMTMYWKNPSLRKYLQNKLLNDL